MINPLAGNPALRKTVYNLFWLVGVLLGAIQITLATASDVDQPWLQAAFAVYAFLGGAVGYTASANVTQQDTLDLDEGLDIEDDLDEEIIDGLDEELPDH